MTITEFLTARYDEDEVAAQRQSEYAIEWYVALESDRILADIAAKRAILALHRPDRQLEGWYWLERRCDECGGTWHQWLPDKRPTDIGPEQGCPTLRILASVYSDHPDYREEWKPWSHSEHCRVYWGHSGCDLPRGHDSGRASRVHRQLEPSGQTVTPLNAFLFGEDLTDEERRQVAELWGVAPWKP